MRKRQKPVPGNYYINLAGQLLRVKCILYSYGEMTRIIIEYLDGKHVNLTRDEWTWLDLTVYSDWFTGHESKERDRQI